MRSISLSLALLLAACAGPVPSESIGASSSTSPSAAPVTGSPGPSATPRSLARAEAIEIARAADSESTGREVQAAEAGLAGELAATHSPITGLSDLPPDQRVWVVVLHDPGPNLEGGGSVAVIDYYTGDVIKWVYFVE